MGRVGEKQLLRLASKQFGVVTARDFSACRISWMWLRRRLETGEWIRLHRGVFKLGPGSPNLDQLEMAAMLAAGKGAVLSHLSAARRLGLEVPRDQSVQLTIPACRHLPKLIGVQVWLSRDLIDRDITKRGPFHVTHLARTMIDLASVLDDKWLRATLDSALRQRKTNLAWISRCLSVLGRGHAGTSRLRALLDEYQGDDEVPDSVLESFGIELARATGHMPRLHWNVLDGARLIAEVDLGWPEVRLCVELDGWAHHGTRSAFVEDRARDRALVALGWIVLRYTWGEVIHNGEALIGEIAHAYQALALSLRSQVSLVKAQDSGLED